MKPLALAALRFYKRFISPLLPSACIFEPTCSVYMYHAIERYGVIKGGIMGLKRIGRCQPFYRGDRYDPVP